MTNENTTETTEVAEQAEAEQSGVRGGDTATRHFSGDELANGAADALHGTDANVENRKQGGATELIGGTLIGDELPNDENGIGRRLDSERSTGTEA